jgi:hypothetical protein
MATDYFFNFKQKLYESEDQFKLPGGWKILPIGKDHKVDTIGQPAGYGLFMTDKNNSYYFDNSPERDTMDSYPTEQKAYDEFMKNYKK